LCNEELHDLFSSPDSMKIISTGEWDQWGMWNDRIEKKSIWAAGWKLWGKITSIPRYRWEDTKTDLKEIGWAWTVLTWLIPVVNFRFYKMWGREFLDYVRNCASWGGLCYLKLLLLSCCGGADADNHDNSAKNFCSTSLPNEEMLFIYLGSVE
jgi:hypothetical protein